MNKSELYQLIEKPALINDLHISDLENVCNKYPFFSIAQTLLCKSYFNAEHFTFPEQLKKAAMYAGDRELLYDLIYYPNYSLKTEHTVNQLNNTVTNEQTSAIEKENKLAEEEKQIEEKKEELKILETLLIDIKNQLKTLAEPPIESKPIELKPTLTEIELIKSEETTEENFEEKIITPINVETPIKSIDIELPLTTDIEEKSEKIVDVNPLIKETIKVDEPLSFADWLLFVKARGIPQNYIVENKHLVKKEDTEAPAKSNQTLNKTGNTENEKQQQKTLIDRFIQEEPKIVPQKGVFFNSPQRAKESATENDDIYSETLAKIFEMQGNFKKAIRAYEILSLKFPEKSAYFADLIEKCNKLLKEK